MYYRPPAFELHEFQFDMIERAISQSSLVIGADCGMGKGIMAIFYACWLFDQNLIDHAIWEVEKGKFSEWEDDLANYSTLTVGKLNGTPDARELVINSYPQVYLGVYETIRTEAASKMPRKVGGRTVQSWVPGRLTEAILGSRILLVQDEASAKIGANRTSALYKSHEYMIKQLRKKGSLRMLGTTATPINRDPLGWFNYARLLDPKKVGKVEDFEDTHVIFDKHDNPIEFRNLDEKDTLPGQISLKEKTGHLLIFKRKTDPDVINLFPKIVPSVEYIELSPQHRGLYDAVRKKAKKADPWEAAQYFSAMRQLAGHPLSLVLSVENAITEGRDLPQVASFLVEQVGVKLLNEIRSTKLDHLVEIINQRPNDQFVVFTFYGQSILPIIQERLLNEGITVTTNHGGLSHKARREAQESFRTGASMVFLTSDAGARGINLPTARCVINYELPLTYSLWWQRINRANRLDSRLATTEVIDLIATDTIEEGIVEIGLKRHAYSDIMLPDNEDGSEYLSADTRREILTYAKEAA